MEEEDVRVNGCGRRGSEWGHIALLDKTKEFFRTCDVEGKGFINRTDMRTVLVTSRWRHFPPDLVSFLLSNVFSLLQRGPVYSLKQMNKPCCQVDTKLGNSYGCQFLHGRRISVSDDQSQAPGPAFKAKEALYQSHWEAKLSGEEDEEERHFCMLLESLGASNVFEE
ncbi:hypothetical protein XENOCAPTIV_005707 [Xenoophorus captivus]|uniref:EF-hand domain-containing protein n=1 Tax=Xenoophorus captivus TaxID=1517983 RepID=A0ABV0QCS0_9TELE